MSKRIVLISGPVSSGKSKLAQLLSEKFGAQVLKTRVIIEESAGLSNPGRLALQNAGDGLDASTDHRWVADALSRFAVDRADDALIVVDAVRTAKQIDHIRHNFGTPITHIHVTASPETLADRYAKRDKRRSTPHHMRS
jgi:adenylosuccinate synthase